MKYRVIYRHKDKYSIAAMCRFFKVSRSGYYDFVKKSLQSYSSTATKASSIRPVSTTD